MQRLGWHSLNTTFDCECGQRHALPIEACHVGEDAAARLAAFAKTKGQSALIVADANTRAAAGEAVPAALRDAGLRIVEFTYPGGPLEATQEEADRVAAAGEGVDLYVAIGSGTLCDLAKAAGHAQGKPVLLYATAASMNGYTSGIVALKVRGLKRTLPCQPAVGIFADPVVVASAPQRMVAAGVADFLSKCSSAADWRVAHRLRGGYFCKRPREFNDGIQERLFAMAPRIGQGDVEGVQLALEALLLSGFGMVVAGSSAPASGGEHLISHYIDMKHALQGTGHDLHGVQVGVATVYTLGLWERVLARDPASLDLDALVAAQPGEDAIRAWIQEDWGVAVGAEVQAQWDAKRPTPEALRAEIQRFVALLPALRAELAEDLQPAATVARVIEQCGGPSTPEGMTVPVAVYDKALSRARYLRDRFTILDLAAELGVTG